MCRNSVVNVIEIEKESISKTVTTCLRPYRKPGLTQYILEIQTNLKFDTQYTTTQTYDHNIQFKSSFQ